MEDWEVECEARRQAAAREQAEDALRRCDEALRDAAARRQEGLLQRETTWAAPAQPDPVPPLRRGPKTPRDWDAEAKWVRSIARQEVAAFERMLAPTMGRVIGEIRKEIDADLAKFAGELEALRTEVEKRKGGDDNLQASLDRLTDNLQKFQQVNLAFAKLDEQLPAPN